MSQPATFSILRIKRKRTTNQLPLDALVIEQPEPSTKRRKATHAPLAPAAAPPSTARGIFRFAETVSLDSFDNPIKTRQVQDRIESFLHRPPAVNAVAAAARPLARIPSSASLRQPLKGRKLPSASLPPSPLGSPLQRKRTRYRIVPEPSSDLAATEASRREEDEIRRGLRPPKVWDSLELKRKQQAQEQAHETRIYDAIAEDELDDDLVRASLKKKKQKNSHQLDARLMDNFGDMLKEYLTLQDSNELGARNPSTLHPDYSTPEPDSSDSEEEDDAEESGEFVYDVYYRDLRGDSSSTAPPGTTSQDLAMSATTSGGFDVASLEGLKRIGALAGLEEDQDLLLRADGEGDFSSEEEDNADQDSNEENDYRNDYPDGSESEEEDRWEQDDDDDHDDDDY